MRVLCFLHSFEPGGVERTALRLCAQWRDMGIDVAVMLGRGTGRARGQAPDLDYRIAPRPGFSTAWIETLWMILWLPRTILRYRPDVLFCAGNSYTVVAGAMKLLLGRRCPPIVAKISNDMMRLDMAPPGRLFYHVWCLLQGRFVDRWIALSPAMAAEAAPLLAVPVDAISILPNPVLDAHRIAALAQAGDRARASQHRGRQPGRRFLAIGRLTPQKNFAALIAAFARGARPGDRLTIVGEGRERRRLETLVLRAGLAGRVNLPGHSNAIDDWIARSDALLLSSLYEGLPGVLVEAMAAGLPVVATDCCASMASLIDGPAVGTLVPAGDVSALADAIAGCACGRRVDAAIDRARLHSVEPAARAYQSIFATLASPSRQETVRTRYRQKTA